jgi:hypothetical protein
MDIVTEYEKFDKMARLNQNRSNVSRSDMDKIKSLQFSTRKARRAEDKKLGIIK